MGGVNLTLVQNSQASDNVSCGGCGSTVDGRG